MREEANMVTEEYIIAQMVGIGHNHWDAQIETLERLATDGLFDLDILVNKAGNRAAEQASRLALVSEYLNRRSCGMDHEEALNEAQSYEAKVRKAMGYTYPER
jgi:hypothetical protein